LFDAGNVDPLEEIPDPRDPRLQGGMIENGYIELFNSPVRDEFLNINMFWSLAQARVLKPDRNAHCNHRRRHSALGYQPPPVYDAARTHP